MPQHDYDIANQSGANFRSDINNVLQAIVTKNSGNTAPSATFAYMWWLDTSGAFPVLKIRNGANNAWIECGRVDLANFGINPTVVSSTAPVTPQAGQFWVDTSGANPILKIRNVGNTAWVDLGRVDTANLGALLTTGGAMSGPITYSNTDSTSVPVGTTAQRPGSPATGMIRFNSDLTQYEGYNGAAWASIGGGGFVVSTTQSITGVNQTINSSTTDQRQMRPVQGNTAPVTLSLTPFGSTGGWRDGTEILLIGVSSTNSVTLTYNDAAKGLVGNFSTIELTNYRSIVCVYSSALDRWIVEGGF